MYAFSSCSYAVNVAVKLDDPLLQKYRYVQYAILFDELDPAWFEVKK